VEEGRLEVDAQGAKPVSCLSHCGPRGARLHAALVGWLTSAPRVLAHASSACRCGRPMRLGRVGQVEEFNDDVQYAQMLQEAVLVKVLVARKALAVVHAHKHHRRKSRRRSLHDLSTKWEFWCALADYDGERWERMKTKADEDDALIVDADGRTCLHWAIAEGSEKEQLAVVIAEQEPRLLTIADAAGDMPLIYAIRNGRVSVAQVLIKTGCAENVRSNNGKGDTALVVALKHCAEESEMQLVVETLMLSGADLEVKSMEGDTPLAVAIKCGQTQSATELLRKGADKDAKDQNGDTPLVVALRFNRQEIVRALVHEKAEMDAKSGDGHPPLAVALQYAREDMALELIDAGATLGVASKDGCPLLYWAEFCGCCGAADVLRERGADDSTVERLRRTDKTEGEKLLASNPQAPLEAAKKGRISEIRQLVAHHVTFDDYRDEEQNTPLHLAAARGHEAVVVALTVPGRCLQERRNSQGRIPLHEAAYAGHAAVVRVLLRMGAPKDDAGRNDSCTPLHIAAERGHSEVVRVLLDGGADPTKEDEKRQTALHKAAWEGYTPVVRLLIKAKRKVVEEKDCDGMSPLHRAVERGHSDLGLLHMLLHANSINLPDNRKLTPLILAVEKGHVEVFTALSTQSTVRTWPGRLPITLLGMQSAKALLDVDDRENAGLDLELKEEEEGEEKSELNLELENTDMEGYAAPQLS